MMTKAGSFKLTTMYRGTLSGERRGFNLNLVPRLEFLRSGGVAVGIRPIRLGQLSLAAQSVTNLVDECGMKTIRPARCVCRQRW